MTVPAHEAEARSRSFHDVMARRRTVRDYSTRPIPDGVLEWAVRTASTAPSGAHVQPWRFVAITDPERKRRLREAAEAEEREFYAHRASAEWLAALALLQARGVNLLVLDEPTNHLDLPAIEQLEQALATFEGTLLLVTHDRRLLESVEITRTVEVHDGQVHEQP